MNCALKKYKIEIKIAINDIKKNEVEITLLSIFLFVTLNSATNLTVAAGIPKVASNTTMLCKLLSIVNIPRSLGPNNLATIID